MLQLGLIVVTVADFYFAACFNFSGLHPSPIWKPEQHGIKWLTNSQVPWERGKKIKNSRRRDWVGGFLKTLTPQSSLGALVSFSRSALLRRLLLTHGAVGPHPVGVAAAQASVWDEGAVAVALVRALGPGQFAVEPSPPRLAVALSVHADAVVGTRRVQAIHCIKTPKRYDSVGKGKKKKRKNGNKQMKGNWDKLRNHTPGQIVKWVIKEKAWTRREFNWLGTEEDYKNEGIHQQMF